MNSCGVNIPHILNKFVHNNDEIQNIIEEYYFSVWYYLLDCNINTIKSYICDIKDSKYVNNLIYILPNNQCFARLDSCSSKPINPYKSYDEIYQSLQCCDRTRNNCYNQKLIIRHWLYNLGEEFRCFIHDNNLRAISTLSNNVKKLVLQHLEKIKETVKQIIFLCDYNDCTIDFCFYNDELLLIEINTPVYLCATSGKFDLDVVSDYEILLGDYIPDIINYPVIK